MKVLFFGPLPPPVTGQSSSFQLVYGLFSVNGFLCNSTKFGQRKVLNTLYCLIKLTYLFVFCKFKIVYFTSTRSHSGFLKDSYLLFLSRVWGKKVINHLHGADFLSFFNSSKFLKPIIRFFYSSIYRSIVLLPSMVNEFNDFNNMKVSTIANCYPVNFDSWKCEFPKKPQLLYFSNLMESKGILFFLDSLKDILSAFPNVDVKIAGAFMGDHLSVKRRIQDQFFERLDYLEKMFPGKVDYLGELFGEEKIKVLSESSVFVLPTFYPTEAFPITIIEAMRMGNAVITCDHNYLAEIITERNGFVIPTHCSKSIAEKVCLLFSDEDLLLKIQENNIREASEKYSPGIFFNKLERAIFY